MSIQASSDIDIKVHNRDVRSLNKFMDDSVQMPNDCHEEEKNYQALLRYKTKCPLVKKQQVIN